MIRSPSMSSRAQVFASAILALACLRCSLLLYNDDELAGGTTPTATDAGGDADSAVEASPTNDASPAQDAATDAGTDAKSFPDAAVVWPVNGHAYEVVVVEGINWDAAKDGADKRGGHLVTITSDAENDFVFDLTDKNPKSWLPGSGDLLLGPWIGCFQPPGSVEPSGGFGWVTGEPLVYDAFAQNQPDNAGGESVCHFLSYGQRAPLWNDNLVTLPLSGYVVEYE